MSPKSYCGNSTALAWVSVTMQPIVWRLVVPMDIPVPLQSLFWWRMDYPFMPAMTIRVMSALIMWKPVATNVFSFLFGVRVRCLILILVRLSTVSHSRNPVSIIQIKKYVVSQGISHVSIIRMIIPRLRMMSCAVLTHALFSVQLRHYWTIWKLVMKRMEHWMLMPESIGCNCVNVPGWALILTLQLLLPIFPKKRISGCIQGLPWWMWPCIIFVANVWTSFSVKDNVLPIWFVGAPLTVW